MEPGSSRPAQAGIQGQSVADVIVEDRGWRHAVPGAAALIVRAIRATGVRANVLLTSDRRVKRLNARHRGINKPTNVLTFGDAAGGDIVLALGVVRREAAEASRRPAYHLAHLVVHGALHLRGHDHDMAGAARRMELAEARILHRLGLPNPWKPAGARG